MKPLFDKIYRRLLRPWDALYYRFFAGGNSALSRRLGAGVLAREQRSGRGDVPQTGAQWDEQYSAGAWDFLAQLSELPRYAVIAGYLRQFAHGGSILDVGCGEGILLRHLEASQWSRYLGIDLSASAIERGQASAPNGATFAVADAEEFQPGERFDAVILNESLYYFHRPVAEARRYFETLKPGGAMVVSIFSGRRSRAIVRQLEREFPPRESCELCTAAGTWILSLYVSGQIVAGQHVAGQHAATQATAPPRDT